MEIVAQLSLDPVCRCQTAEPQRPLARPVQAFEFGWKRFAIGEFQQVQVGGVADRDHWSQWCLEPIGFQDRI